MKWNHISIARDARKINKYRHCFKIINNQWIHQMKHQRPQSKETKVVVACKFVSDEVKKEMWVMVSTRD